MYFTGREGGIQNFPQYVSLFKFSNFAGSAEAQEEKKKRKRKKYYQYLFLLLLQLSAIQKLSLLDNILSVYIWRERCSFSQLLQAESGKTNELLDSEMPNHSALYENASK